MIMNKKGQAGIILIIAAIFIILGLSAYFIIKELSPQTGMVVANNDINDVIKERITTVSEAVQNSPTLPSNNPTETSITDAG